MPHTPTWQKTAISYIVKENKKSEEFLSTLVHGKKKMIFNTYVYGNNRKVMHIGQMHVWKVMNKCRLVFFFFSFFLFFFLFFVFCFVLLLGNSQLEEVDNASLRHTVSNWLSLSNKDWPLYLLSFTCTWLD